MSSPFATSISADAAGIEADSPPRSEAGGLEVGGEPGDVGTGGDMS